MRLIVTELRDDVALNTSNHVMSGSEDEEEQDKCRFKDKLTYLRRKSLKVLTKSLYRNPL